MNRLRVSSLLVYVLLFVMLVVGCQPGATSAPAVDSKSIIIVIPEDPPSFNPIVSDTGYDALVMELVMLGLSDIDAQGNMFRELAAELPYQSTGGRAVWK